MNALCIWVKEPSRPWTNLGHVGPLLKGLLSRINKIPPNRVIPNKKAAAAAKQGVVALQPKKKGSSKTRGGGFTTSKQKGGVPTSKSLDITSIDDDANANDTTIDSADSTQLCDDNTTDNSFQQIAFEDSLDDRSNPEEQPYTSDITDYGCARNTRSRSKI